MRAVLLVVVAAAACAEPAAVAPRSASRPSAPRAPAGVQLPPPPPLPIAPAIEITGAGLDSAARDAVVARVRDAYVFAARENGWTTAALAAVDGPLEVHVIPLPAGTAARTTGPRVFEVDPDVLGHDDVDGVLAHELTHVQDLRAARKALGRIPRYLEEGKALAIGHAYRMSRHECGDDARRREAIAGVSGETARDVLQTFRDGAALQAAGRAGETFLWMSVAVYFVEYARVRIGPDAGARLSRVWERLGRGEDIDAAFASELGTALDALERDFVDHVTKTQGDRAARLAGSSFDNACTAP